MEFTQEHIYQSIRSLTVNVEGVYHDDETHRAGSMINVVLVVDDSQSIKSRGPVYEDSNFVETVQILTNDALAQAIRHCTVIHKLNDGDALKVSPLYNRVMEVVEQERLHNEYKADMDELE